MKKLLIILCLSISSIAVAEERSVEVYKTNPLTGVRNPFPEKTVVITRESTKVYDHSYAGVRNPFPEKEIVINNRSVTGITTSQRPTISPNLLPQGSVTLGSQGISWPYQRP